jgi:hypothetical protein
MRRPVLLVLVAIVLGLGGLYLLRAAVVDAGGFSLGTSAAQNHLAQLVQDWRFPASGALLLIVLLIKLSFTRRAPHWRTHESIDNSESVT